MPDTDLARPLRDPRSRAVCPVSPRLGPISEVLEYLPERGEPREWRLLATGAAVDIAHGVVTPAIGEGRGTSRELAWQRCVHEFAERLALREPPVPDGPPPGGGCPLADRAIQVRDLADGTLGEAPMGDFYLHPKTCPRTRTTTSSGAATADAFWPAAERGLLELLERDALVAAWRYRRPAPRVPATLIREDLERLTRAGLRVDLANLTAAHGVPTVACVVGGTVRGHPLRAMGSAADRTLARAASRAAGEAAAAYSMCVRRLVTVGDAAPLTFTEPSDNAFYHLRPDRQPALDRIFADAEDASAPELTGTPRELTGELARRLAARHIRTLAADITPDWQRRRGLATVVTRSPDLFPFEIGPGDPGLARRLVEHPSRRGLDKHVPDASPLPLA